MLIDFKRFIAYSEEDFGSKEFNLILKRTSDNARILSDLSLLLTSKEINEDELKRDVEELINTLQVYFFKYFLERLELEYYSDPEKVKKVLGRVIKRYEVSSHYINEHKKFHERGKNLFEELEKLDFYLRSIIKRMKSFAPDIENQRTKPTLPPDPKTPFNDPKTHELFNYIVDNWNYDKGQKWADIWNVINDIENYTPPYKNEYQNYIITRFGYTGKFQYDKPKKDGNRDKQNLLELIENFSIK